MKSFINFLKDPFGKKAKEKARMEALQSKKEALDRMMRDIIKMDKKPAEEQDETLPPASPGTIVDFQPIQGLKPGMKVKWKGPRFKAQKWPKLEEVVTVYAVNPPVAANKPGVIVVREDFTVLYDDGDHVMEFAHDSRRFVVVED